MTKQELSLLEEFIDWKIKRALGKDMTYISHLASLRSQLTEEEKTYSSKLGDVQGLERNWCSDECCPTEPKPKERWKPLPGGDFYWIDEEGLIVEDYLASDETEFEASEFFLGVYETRKEAEIARDKIKKLLHE